MDTREKFFQYMQNDEGGNAACYIKALDLLDGIVRRIHFFDLPDFWSVDSIDDVEKLYRHALHFEKKDGSAFLRQDLSCGRNGYYSAALKRFKDFLILRQDKAGR